MEDNSENCKVGVVYHEMYNGRGFSRLARSWERYGSALTKMQALGLVAPDLEISPEYTNPNANYESEFVALWRPTAATDVQLTTVHSWPYIQYVHIMDEKGEGYFDRNDTPAWHGVFRRAALAAGGTILAADLVAKNVCQHVFHVAGGLHHAQYEKASGFCIFNDIVAAVRRWQSHYGYERIAILDVDGHHGDGTQQLLWREPILTVSLHQYDGRFFPRTGALEERGEGPGRHFAVNFPLPRYTTDELYLPVLEVALEAIENYQPQAIIVQFGVDGHFSDRMVGLKLSTRTYEAVIQKTHTLAHRICAGRLVMVGGGGYEPETVARCWAMLVANLSGKKKSLGAEYGYLHDPTENLPLLDATAQQKVGQMLEQAQKLFL